jgi:hypothetical protein
MSYIYSYYQKKVEIVSSDNTHIRSSSNDFKDLIYSAAWDIELKKAIPPTISVFSYDYFRAILTLSLFWSSIHNKEEMFIFLREYFDGNTSEQEQCNSFVNEYSWIEEIDRYMKRGRLFQIGNRACRIENIDNIFKFRYSLQDLCN